MKWHKNDDYYSETSTCLSDNMDSIAAKCTSGFSKCLDTEILKYLNLNITFNTHMLHILMFVMSYANSAV